MLIRGREGVESGKLSGFFTKSKFYCGEFEKSFGANGAIMFPAVGSKRQQMLDYG